MSIGPGLYYPPHVNVPSLYPYPFMWNFDPDAVTFDAKMAKRALSAGPFDVAPIFQGDAHNTDNLIDDSLTFEDGNMIHGTFQQHADSYQGSVAFWWTPPVSSGGTSNYIYPLQVASNIYCHWRESNGNWYFRVGNVAMNAATTYVAGNTYFIVFRWDVKNTLDGTNYLCTSVNDSHTFGGSSAPGYPVTLCHNDTLYLGNSQGAREANPGIIQGYTIYRRPLWDGSYGINVGNGDEINLMYNAGSGKDPCEVTGSWDVPFCAPTNQSEGELTTGEGEAWSHPHASSVIDGSFMEHESLRDTGESNFVEQVTNVGSVFGGIAANSLDDLHDNEFTVGMWISWSFFHQDRSSQVIRKGNINSNGWYLNIGTNSIYGRVECATTTAISFDNGDASLVPNDGKMHYVTMYFNDAGDRKVYLAVDGVWVSTYNIHQAGVGAIVSDAAANFCLGQCGLGKIGFGWVAIWSDDHHGHGVNFTPPTSAPTSGGNLVEAWHLHEGTGSTCAAEVSGSNDLTINNGNWKSVWDTVGTPSSGPSDITDSERVYQWGCEFTCDAANEGVKRSLSGLTPGDEYVIRVVAHEDSTQNIKIVVYDETNGANIISTTFGSGSSRTAPGVYINEFALPALCTEISVQVLGSANAQTVYLHQVELYAQNTDYSAGDYVGGNGTGSLSNCEMQSGSGSPSGNAVIRVTGASPTTSLDWEIALDPVSITVTPASEVNSTETNGLRVDGLDQCTQPITDMSAGEKTGKMSFKVTPRHAAADVAKFGETTPYIFVAWGDADDYIKLYWSAANTITLAFNDGGGEHSDTWDATGAIDADTEYLFEIEWDETQMTLSVDSVVKITISQQPTFDVALATAYIGQDGSNQQQGDAVFGAP